jgi:sirohydrochlorin ferrochelatase
MKDHIAPRLDRAKTAVLLIAHGSRNDGANRDLFELAGRLEGGGGHPIVEASFLELAEPGITVGGDRCVDRGAEVVLMVPYFLSSGVHLNRDLTEAREELQAKHPAVRFRLGVALGPDPLLDDLVVKRIEELGGGGD